MRSPIPPLSRCVAPRLSVRLLLPFLLPLIAWIAVAGTPAPGVRVDMGRSYHRHPTTYADSHGSAGDDTDAEGYFEIDARAPWIPYISADREDGATVMLYFNEDKRGCVAAPCKYDLQGPPPPPGPKPPVATAPVTPDLGPPLPSARTEASA